MTKLIIIAVATLAFCAASNASTLHVSKLGDNSDGGSWARAFHSVQAALSAVPEGGGHRIIVRPDTYMEDNLFTAHPGAEGAYNELIGDTDGALGSGATGWVVLDAGDPAQQGFKSYDWWGNIKSYTKAWSPEHTAPTFSAICWDRWKLKGLYATGADGGLFFDCTDRVEPFTVIVEDCVAIGRAFGGGVASCISRHDEPITFRRCALWALDFWGDTAGAYIRVENESMPEQPDVLFEDCTMVGPQCALKSSNFGFDTHSPISLDRCRLIALNFSQPHGTPTDGAIQSVQEGKLLHVDLRDTTVMGFKVFGVMVNKDTAAEISFTTSGDCKAYVQFQQAVPEGFTRLGHWPVDVFEHLVPPSPEAPGPLANRELVAEDMCELTPIIWRGKLCHMESVRPAQGGAGADYYLRLVDATSGDELTRFAEGYGLGCAVVDGDILHAFASRWGDDGSWNDVTHFWSSDLASWESERVVEQDPDEHLFNTSVCAGPDGYVMAYETNDPSYPAFTVKFARSDDLVSWQKVPHAIFDTDRYTACPCIRHVDGYYHMLYLERRAPRWFFETYLARSSDLITWRLAPGNSVLTPEGIDEGINASDPELIEIDGVTHVYLCVGDQRTWMSLKRATFAGTMGGLFATYFGH